MPPVLKSIFIFRYWRPNGIYWSKKTASARSSIASINYFTHFILGGVLLLLCIILASFFLYSFCKKHFCPGISHREYVIVPTEHTATNGQIVLKKFSSEGKKIIGLFCSTLTFYNSLHMYIHFFQI